MSNYHLFRRLYGKSNANAQLPATVRCRFATATTNVSVPIRYRRFLCAYLGNGISRTTKYRSSCNYTPACPHYFSSTLGHGHESGTTGDVDAVDQFLLSSELYGPNNSLRNIFYTDSQDQVIKKLKSCSKSAQVFQIIEEESGGPYAAQHLVQAVLTLRDIYRLRELAVEFSSQNRGDNADQHWCQKSRVVDEENDAEDLHDTVVSSPRWLNFVNAAVSNAPLMNLGELSCCIMYLCRLHVDRHRVLPFIDEFEKKLKNVDHDQVPLSTWERFVIPVKEFRNIWSFYTLSNTALPVIVRQLGAT